MRSARHAAYRFIVDFLRGDSQRVVVQSSHNVVHSVLAISSQRVQDIEEGGLLGIDEISENMENPLRPLGADLNARDDLQPEPHPLGLRAAHAANGVVIRDGYGSQPFSESKGDHLFRGERSVGHVGVNMKVDHD